MITSKQELMWHLGHNLEVAFYGEKDDPVSVTIECITCSSVLVNFEDHTDYDMGADSYEEENEEHKYIPYDQGYKQGYNNEGKYISEDIPYSVCPYRKSDSRRIEWACGYTDGESNWVLEKETSEQ